MFLPAAFRYWPALVNVFGPATPSATGPWSRCHCSVAARALAPEVPLSLRITRYVRTHLADPTPSAVRIAAAHGIPVRHLCTVLSRPGISLGDRIRSHRPAECRREPAGPGGRTRTIAGIGRSWGFMDATHFSKVFKQAYGISPRTWRDQHHPAPARKGRAGRWPLGRRTGAVRPRRPPFAEDG
ncbi:hypothetical protein B7767_30630 [Streptomyces sp. 13-12-16]|nr:hypothetical protein B7767_30630 [Streptomyces sp. 13-12-16]